MSKLKRFSSSLKSTYHDHQGAILAALATIVWTACVGGFNIESGFGRLTDFAFAFGVALIGIPIVALAFASLLALLRLLPRLFTGFLVAAVIYLSLIWDGFEGWMIAACILLVECLLGASVAALISGRVRKAASWRRIGVWSAVVLTVAANIALFMLFHEDGIDEELMQIQQAQVSLPAPLAAADPSQPGPYQVKTLYYGSGDSLRRPEFGPSVAIKTKTVDASPFFKDFDGWKAWIRKRYWGFGMDKLPLNARVFYPVGAGPFPLFILVHGNHEMSVASDNGYVYLCQLLASRGFIAVTVDENFINSGLFHDPPKQQAVRGWLLLEHLRLWHEWASNPQNPFYGKVDLNEVALGGHSRGGEAAATAALFNKMDFYPDDATIAFHYHFPIKSVIAIAPADGQYKPAQHWRILNDVNYFTLQGANDSDVSSFMGSRQYDHVRFSGVVPAFKSELYIYRANHGQFNTMWGRTDIGAPGNWLLNLRPLLAGDAQRQIAKVYLSAFLEATLHNRAEYVDLFRDYRTARKWVPQTLYVNRYQDQSYKDICSFDEDADVTTTTLPGGHISTHELTVWKEEKIPYRDGNRDYNGAVIGWNWEGAKKPPATPPDYRIDLPPGLNLPALALSIAATDDDAPKPDKKHAKTNDDAEEKDEPTDFTVEAVDASGVSARVDSAAFMPLLPPLHVQFTKLEILDKQWYKASSEPIFQTIRVPFEAFLKKNAAFNTHQVRSIRLLFDKTPTRVVILSGIGLESF